MNTSSFSVFALCLRQAELAIALRTKQDALCNYYNKMGGDAVVRESAQCTGKNVILKNQKDKQTKTIYTTTTTDES